MKSSTTPEPSPRPRPRRSTVPLVQLTSRPDVAEASNGPGLHVLPAEPADRRTEDDLLVVAAHLDRVQAILAQSPGRDRAVAATHYLATLEDCRRDVIAVRDISIHSMNTVGRLGGVRIAAALGLNASRGQQLIYRAQATHAEAAQHIARLRRRLASRHPGQ